MGEVSVARRISRGGKAPCQVRGSVGNERESNHERGAAKEGAVHARQSSPGPSAGHSVNAPVNRKAIRNLPPMGLDIAGGDQQNREGPELQNPSTGELRRAR